MPIFLNVRGLQQSFLSKSQSDFFFPNAISSRGPHTCPIYSDAGAQVKFLGIADLEILGFWESYF